jgi:hypothetical protein
MARVDALSRTNEKNLLELEAVGQVDLSALLGDVRVEHPHTVNPKKFAICTDEAEQQVSRHHRCTSLVHPPAPPTGPPPDHPPPPLTQNQLQSSVYVRAITVSPTGTKIRHRTTHSRTTTTTANGLSCPGTSTLSRAIQESLFQVRSCVA